MNDTDDFRIEAEDSELENRDHDSSQDLGDGEIDGEDHGSTIVPFAHMPPGVLPALVLDDLVPFPGPILPVLLDSKTRRDAVLDAKNGHGFVLMVNQAELREDVEDGQSAGDIAASVAIADVMSTHTHREEDSGEHESETDIDEQAEDIEQKTHALEVDAVHQLAPVGVIGRIIRVFQLPDGRLSALIELKERVRPVALVSTEPFYTVRILPANETVVRDDPFEARFRQLQSTLRKFLESHTGVPDELKMMGAQIKTPQVLTDFVAQHLCRSFSERIELLCELDLGRRLERTLEVAIRELDLLTIGNRISEEIRERVEQTQREYFLREQLKAIRRELGEEKDPAALAVEELQQRLEDAGLPEIARERADDELKRLQLIPSESPEHGVIRSYLDWIASLPWKSPEEEVHDIVRARKVLDEDHYGLEEVKDRLIEFLAVRQLNPERPGGLLCLAGPPGVGKTSLGRSIARALGREFYRFSVGGMRDEAEIKGHRRTYVGAMPGRILQAMKSVGTPNPVIMLDELDKMGSDWRGDPSSAMLEVLDPAQNKSFLDHYLDLPFDLSNVMFVATANVKANIPGPLLDRLEVIDLSGYIPTEKVEIAARHLVTRQRKAHGLNQKQFKVGKPALRQVVTGYTHEAGVRELDRLIGKLARKRATEVVQKESFEANIRPDGLVKYLGPQKIFDERLTNGLRPGLAIGLAWTPAGGDVLFIEAIQMKGKGQLKVTGQLGEVMAESARIAMSYVRAHASDLGVDQTAFDAIDVHLHFPAGAVPKDGPSAGVTITTALMSLLLPTSIKPRLAMTGEMTLRGDVLPVGGIREKVVAARRSGIRTVIVPKRNQADVEKIPEDIVKGIDFVFASHFDEVRNVAFAKRGAKGKSK